MKRFLLVLLAVALGVSVISATSLASPQSSARTAKLMIIHVQKGCHVWSAGTKQAAHMTINLRHGDRLQISNVDVDAHKLVQMAGSRMNTGGMMMAGGMMMTGHGTTITFSKPGVYKFKTVVVEMKGMPEVETTGPDNKLTLTVRVA